MVGLAGTLSWMNTYSYSKKQCRSLFWKMRAAVKKAIKNGGSGKGKQQFKFQYDPSSYALNFDDGCCEMGEKARAAFYQQPPNSKLQNCSKSTTTTTTWIFVIWVQSEP